MAKNYENECPKDVLEAATLSVDCRSDLESLLGRISITPANDIGKSC